MDVLVVDSGAIIKGHGTNFHRIAKRFVTIDEVVSEIRDSKSRDLLLKLPFDLEICQPTEKAMKAIADFTRKSGDFSSLSLTDLKVLALSYSLEMENNNGRFLRDEPKGVLDVTVKKQGRVFEDNTLPAANPGEPCGCSLEDASIHDPQPDSVAPTGEQPGSDEANGRPCSPPLGEAEGKKQFQADRLEWLAQREAGQGDQVRIVEARGGFAEGGATGSTEADKIADVEGENSYEHECDFSSDYEDDEDYEYHEDGGQEAAEAGEQREIDLNAITDEEFPSLGFEGAIQVPDVATLGEVVSKWASVVRSDSANANETVKFAKAEVNSSAILENTHQYNAVDHFSGNGSNAELEKFLKEESRAESLREAARQNEQRNIEKAGLEYDRAATQMPSRILSGGQGGSSKVAAERAMEEDNGEGWIGSDNIKECMISGKNMIGNQTTKAQVGSTSPIGCVTTDFTMQNVMMKMNLRVVSVDGMQIRTVRQWVMRCMACYTIHTDMNRIFCSRCGVDHMSRVACSIDASTGQLRLHLKSNYQVSKRGKQYSMPAPGKQGRFEGELLTREDQLMAGIWRQKVVKMQKDVRSAFGQDITSDLGLQVNKSVHIRPGLGRPNPNADKGRERRGKSKRKAK
eukprot:GSChrysophyteH1.ASY1.ANO1.398.1 assembled CDS